MSGQRWTDAELKTLGRELEARLAEQLPGYAAEVAVLGKLPDWLAAAVARSARRARSAGQDEMVVIVAPAAGGRAACLLAVRDFGAMIADGAGR